MTQIELHEYTDRALLHTAILFDNGHHLFVGEQWLMGNDTKIEVYKYDEALTVLGHWTITPPPQIKIDDFAMAQNGSDISFVHVGHKAVTGTRPNPLIYVPDELRGAATPYPSGQPQLGGKFNAMSEPNPNPAPYTLEEIANAVNDMLQARLNGELGNQVQKKAVNAIRQETPAFLKSEEAFGTALYNSNGLFRRLTETVWFQFWKTSYETHLLQFLANSLHTDIQIPDPVCADLHLNDCVIHGH